jgi:hypothetical protein
LRLTARTDPAHETAGPCCSVVLPFRTPSVGRSDLRPLGGRSGLLLVAQSSSDTKRFLLAMCRSVTSIGSATRSRQRTQLLSGARGCRPFTPRGGCGGATRLPRLDGCWFSR